MHRIAHSGPTGACRCTCGTVFGSAKDFAFHEQTANHTESSYRARHEAMVVAHQLAPIGVSIGNRPDVDVLGSLPEVSGQRITYRRPNGQRFEILVTELAPPTEMVATEIAAAIAQLETIRSERQRGTFEVRWHPLSNPDNFRTAACRVDTGLGGWYIVVPDPNSPIDGSWCSPDPVYSPVIHGTFDQILTPVDDTARTMRALVKTANGVW